MRRILLMLAAMATLVSLAAPASAAAAPSGLKWKATTAALCTATAAPVNVTTDRTSLHVRQASASTAAASSLTGYAAAESDHWTNEADLDKRQYYYIAEAWLVWTQSSPDCTQPDTYAAELEITCWRYNPSTGGRVQTACNWPGEYLALWRNPGSGFTNPYGYHKWVRGKANGCSGANGGHALADSTTAQARLITKPAWYDPFGTAILHTSTVRRMMGSDLVRRGVVTGGNSITGKLVESPLPAASDVTAGPDPC